VIVHPAGGSGTSTPAGSRSVITTSFAVDGPLLPTVTVQLSASPGWASTRSGTLAILRSARAAEPPATAAPLSARSGSGTSDNTEAEFAISAGRTSGSTSTVTVVVTVAPGARGPS
jgi:hypothetical protein